MVLHQKLLPSHSSGTQCVKLCGPNCQVENLLGFVLSSDVTEMRYQRFELPVISFYIASLPPILFLQSSKIKIMTKSILIINTVVLLWRRSAMNSTLWTTLKDVFVVLLRTFKAKNELKPSLCDPRIIFCSHTGFRLSGNRTIMVTWWWCNSRWISRSQQSGFLWKTAAEFSMFHSQPFSCHVGKKMFPSKSVPPGMKWAYNTSQRNSFPSCWPVDGLLCQKHFCF